MSAPGTRWIGRGTCARRHAIQFVSERAKSMALSSARRDGATTLTSPVEGCTFTIRRRARGLRRTVTATGRPSMRKSSRRGCCLREDVVRLRMDFPLPAGLACLAIRLKRALDMIRPRFHLAFPVRFLIEPTVRFPGQPGEQATMFFSDPSGNALEIKAFASDAMVFAE